MRRVCYYGYNEKGEFVIGVRESDPGFATEDQGVTLTRAECQKISRHMQFGKKGDERVTESVEGKEV